MNQTVNGLRIILTIVDRKKGKRVVNLLETCGCYHHQIFLGKGTAPQEIFEYLGFGEIEKDIVLSIATVDRAPILLKLLQEEMDFDQPGHGMACSIPIDSVAGQSVLNVILGNWQKGDASK